MAPPRKLTLLLLLLALLLGALPALHRPRSVAAWEQEDYEIFDLVDEVEKVAGENENFYTLLGVEPHANLKEISSGYRRQSLQWHPDKNDSPQASRRQKLIGVVASVLRDDESRKRYDFFLQNGVPRWRGTGYYYRRHRPGLGSVLVGLVVFVSLLQYLGAWVLCVRRRAMFREVLAEEAEVALRRMPRRSTKKTSSKGRLPDDSASESNASGNSTPLLTAEGLLSEAACDPMNDPVVQFPSPSPKDVLIFQLPRAVLRGLLALPGTLADFLRGIFAPGSARRGGKKGDDENSSDSEDEKASGPRGKADARKRAAGDKPSPSKKQAAAVRRMANRRPVNPKFVPTSLGESGAASSKEWTDAEVAQLKDLTAKFPPGTSGRWALVSRALGREEREVVAKAKEIK